MISTLKQVRMLHFAFITTWFLFLFLLRYLNPPEKPVAAFLLLALGVVCVSNIGLALFFRSRYLTSSAETLRAHPDDATALARWRVGNVLSFTFAETVTLFGVLLEFLGAGWRVSGIFFAVGLLLLVAWTPTPVSTAR